MNNLRAMHAINIQHPFTGVSSYTTGSVIMPTLIWLHTYVLSNDHANRQESPCMSDTPMCISSLSEVDEDLEHFSIHKN